jgi:DMSO/TMAO reductase YedYZ heme-binding membrane subunit
MSPGTVRDRSLDATTVDRPLRLLGVTFAVTSAYAIVRYVVAGPVPVIHVPIFVLNKSVAWTALVLLCLALVLGPLAGRWPQRYGAWCACRKALGLLGFLMACGHLLLSVLILNYGYYRAYFSQAFEFTPLAELTLAAGVWAFLLWLPALAASLPGVREALSARAWRVAHGCLPVALVATTAHILKDAPVWWRPADWPAGLPPISLITVVLAATTLGLRWALGAREGTAP